MTALITQVAGGLMVAAGVAMMNLAAGVLVCGLLTVLFGLAIEKDN